MRIILECGILTFVYLFYTLLYNYQEQVHKTIYSVSQSSLIANNSRSRGRVGDYSFFFEIFFTNRRLSRRAVCLCVRVLRKFEEIVRIINRFSTGRATAHTHTRYCRHKNTITIYTSEYNNDEYNTSQTRKFTSYKFPYIHSLYMINIHIHVLS